MPDRAQKRNQEQWQIIHLTANTVNDMVSEILKIKKAVQTNTESDKRRDREIRASLKWNKVNSVAMGIVSIAFAYFIFGGTGAGVMTVISTAVGLVWKIKQML